MMQMSLNSRACSIASAKTNYKSVVCTRAECVSNEKSFNLVIRLDILLCLHECFLQTVEPSTVTAQFGKHGNDLVECFPTICRNIIKTMK